jgi:hypothetical protein
MVLGLVFLVPHLITTRAAVFRDLSWMVGLLISLATLLFYYATSALIDLIAETELRISAGLRYLYMRRLTFWLSDPKFLLAGTFFGFLNCTMGYLFGLQYRTLPSLLTIFWGYFVVGFVCGMAAYGLSGVIGFMRGFVTANPTLDYREPDRCGGTSFLGEALVKFSLVNLIMGVLISFYIVYAPWTNRNHTIVRIFGWAWIGFPFLISLVHLLGPGTVIHRLLRKYKKQEQRTLLARLRQTRARIPSAGVDAKALREELEYELRLQAELYKMKTWPFSLDSAVHYAIGFCVDTVPACVGALRLLKENRSA